MLLTLLVVKMKSIILAVNKEQPKQPQKMPDDNKGKQKQDKK